MMDPWRLPVQLNCCWLSAFHPFTKFLHASSRRPGAWHWYLLRALRQANQACQYNQYTHTLARTHARPHVPYRASGDPSGLSLTSPSGPLPFQVLCCTSLNLADLSPIVLSFPFLSPLRLCSAQPCGLHRPLSILPTLLRPGTHSTHQRASSESASPASPTVENLQPFFLNPYALSLRKPASLPRFAKPIAAFHVACDLAPITTHSKKKNSHVFC
ncbi:hypothetical protein B0T22DRAFT_91866 [Podospora appendiculata]|uniref:Uncharacterized protein n=1 Tax=Podospora appendiculata TaxID=314037 RepID=A0AAE0XKG6_9PEZI|nr:hypothetical protein B0T22DRAFT_91866 [Podospora appendiculata]